MSVSSSNSSASQVSLLSLSAQPKPQRAPCLLASSLACFTRASFMIARGPLGGPHAVMHSAPRATTVRFMRAPYHSEDGSKRFGGSVASHGDGHQRVRDDGVHRLELESGIRCV